MQGEPFIECIECNVCFFFLLSLFCKNTESIFLLLCFISSYQLTDFSSFYIYYILCTNFSRKLMYVILARKNICLVSVKVNLFANSLMTGNQPSVSLY